MSKGLIDKKKLQAKNSGPTFVTSRQDDGRLPDGRTGRLVVGTGQVGAGTPPGAGTEGGPPNAATLRANIFKLIFVL